MSLPTLPEPWRTDADGEEHYSPVCMKAYGQQCRDAALEEAAKVCDEAYDVFFAKHELEVPKHRYSADSVKRSIKAGVEFVTSDCATNIRKLK